MLELMLPPFQGKRSGQLQSYSIVKVLLITSFIQTHHYTLLTTVIFVNIAIYTIINGLKHICQAIRKIFL